MIVEALFIGQLVETPSYSVDYMNKRWGSAGARLGDDNSLRNSIVIHNTGDRLGAIPAWTVSNNIQQPPRVAVQSKGQVNLTVGDELAEPSSLVPVSNNTDGCDLRYEWITRPTTDTLGDFIFIADQNFPVVVENTYGKITMLSIPAEGGEPFAFKTDNIIPEESVLISARPNKEYRFLRWEVNGGTLASYTSASTNLTMGNNGDTEIKAFYELDDVLIPPINPEIENPNKDSLSIRYASSLVFPSVAKSMKDEQVVTAKKDLNNIC